MSQNVEDYGVKVNFDNSEFNQNIDSSEKKLDGFQNAISSFSRSVSNIRFNGNINLGELLNLAATTTGLHRISEEIRNLEEPIQTVSRKAITIVEQTINAAFQQIKNGGIQRALNIEAAKFQIEGLKLDVDTFMEAADYAVSGTAYSLDAAAKVASQLGASGITQLEELKKALRGVSGVAAMANTDFESIGHIFTTVAGQGKLMTMQMQQLSYRGLNIAAELGKVLNKSEAEIRDMVSKGKIDFKTFAMAMDDAFGEHAKDANKTFTGAMSNIRAALSRVGEAFATPVIQNAVDVFNQIRLSINEVKSSLQDNFVFEYFGEIVGKIADNLTRLIESFRYAKDVSPFLEEVSFLAKDIFNIVEQIQAVLFHSTWGDFKQVMDALAVVVEKTKQILNAFKEAFDEVFGINKVVADFKSVGLWLVSLLKSFEELDDSAFKEVFVNWLSIIKDVLKAMGEILGISFNSRKVISDTFREIIKWVNEFVRSLKISKEEVVDNITRIGKGLASVAYLVKQFVSTAFSYAKPIIDRLLYLITHLGEVILSVLANVGDFFTKLAETEKHQKRFEIFFESLTKYFKGISDFMKKIGGAFSDIFMSTGDDKGSGTFIEKIFEFISRVGELATEALSNLNFNGIDFAPIQEFIKNIANFGFSQDEISNTESIFDKSKAFVDRIITFISDILGKIFKGKNSTGSSEEVENDTFSITDFIYKVLVWIKDLVETLVNNVDPGLLVAGTLVGLSFVIDSFANVLDALLNGIAAVLAVILGFVAESDIKKFLNSVANPFEQLQNLMKVLTDLSEKIPDIVEVIRDSVASFHPLAGAFSLMGVQQPDTFADGLAKVLKAFAWLVGVTAAALFAIALIPANDLKKAEIALGIMTVLIGAIAVVFAILSKLMDPLSMNYRNPLISMATSVVLLGAAMIEMAAAFKIMSKALEGMTVGQVFGVLGIITAIITLVSAVFLAFTFLQNYQTEHKDLAIKFLQLSGAFALMGFAILEISAAITLIASTLQNKDDVAKAWAATGMIAAMVGIIAVLLGAIAYFTESKELTLIAAGGAMALVLGGIAMLISSLSALIITLSLLDPDQLDKLSDLATSLLWAVGIITIVLSLIGLIAGLIGELGAVGLLAMAAMLVSFSLLMASLAAPILAGALGFLALAKFLEGIKELIEALKSLNDEDIETIGNNLKGLLSKFVDIIPKAIATYIVNMLESLKIIFPYVQQFISTDLINYIGTTMNMIAKPLTEKAMETFITVLTVLKTYLPEILDNLKDILLGPGQLLDNVYEWLDEFWDKTVIWLEERIPVWVSDVAKLLLIFIKALNAALTENWDEFDKEISELIQNTIALIKEIITGVKTVADVKDLVGTIIEHMGEAVQENLPILRQAFYDLAGEAIAGFVEGLTDSGGSDLLGMLGMDFSIDSIGNSISKLKNAFSNGGGLNLDGIFNGNSLPYRTNMDKMDNYNRIMRGINNNNSQDINVTISANAKTDNLFDFVVDKTNRKARTGGSPMVPGLRAY